MPSHLRIVIVVEMTELLRPKACALVEEAVWLRDLDHFPQELSVFLLAVRAADQICGCGIDHHVGSHSTLLDGLDDLLPPTQICR